MTVANPSTEIAINGKPTTITSRQKQGSFDKSHPNVIHQESEYLEPSALMFDDSNLFENISSQ